MAKRRCDCTDCVEIHTADTAGYHGRSTAVLSTGRMEYALGVILDMAPGGIFVVDGVT
jgi:hypothetical protein